MPSLLRCGLCLVAEVGLLLFLLSIVLHAQASPDQGPVRPDPNAYRVRNPTRGAAGALDGKKITTNTKTDYAISLRKFLGMQGKYRIDSINRMNVPHEAGVLQRWLPFGQDFGGPRLF